MQLTCISICDLIAFVKRENYRFEVVDMDGHRVDKILLTKLN